MKIKQMTRKGVSFPRGTIEYRVLAPLEFCVWELYSYTGLEAVPAVIIKSFSSDT
jgi:hypothetical protein